VKKNTDIKFNYIVTIHNKQDIIGKVILNIIACMNSNSTLYPVLDGCTDDSEEIIDQIIKTHPNKDIKKIYAADVHELKSINEGLRNSDQSGVGYNIILQDDVVLKAFDIEKKIIELYSQRPNLGLVSFRQGGNISRNLIKKNTALPPITNRIENIKGHNYNPFSVLQLGCFTYREVVIKSPICIPFEVINIIGLPDETYAPWDDLGYCYSALKAGFDNGIYAIDFESDVSWGTTRTKKQKVSVSEVEKKNILIFKTRHRIEILSNRKNKIYNNKVYLIHNSPAVVHDNINFINGVKAYLKSRIRYFLNVLFSK